MPNPNRPLLRISDTKNTYITDILHNHQQSLREKARTDDTDTFTTITPIVSGPAAITTLASDVKISNNPEEPSKFPSTFPYHISMEEPNSVTYYEPSDSPSVDPSSFSEIFPPDIPSEKPIPVPTSDPSDSTSLDPSLLSSPLPSEIPLKEHI